MKAKHGYLILAAVLLLLCVLIGFALLGVQFLRQRQERARLEYLPPVVQITEPQSGVSAPAGSYLSAVSIITFSPQSPVQTVEWYLNGALAESHSIQPGAGDSQAYDSYNLLIPTEGTHLLVARAINTHGEIGQSQPLNFQGVAKGEAFHAVTVNEGETLESLAAGYGSEAATLQTLNPGLINPPPPGTTIKVPVPPENELPSPTQAPPAVSGGVTLVSTSPMLKVADIPSNIFSLLIATAPQAPTFLQGEVKDCQVKLLWEDNATNESGYEIWMAAPGAPLTHLVTLQPASGGVTWYEFQAPGPGYLLFWVEAVNAIGQQGSNIIYLNVDAGCPAGAATHLQVEILDIAVSASAERIYCYVSFENTPEARLPAQDGDFIAVQGGHGNLTPWPHTFAMPIPPDNALDLSGECWGWAGQDLSKLGTFTASLGSETWDGAPRLVHGGAFDMSLSVLPQGMGGKRMTYSNDINPPKPRNFRLEYEVDNYNCKLGCWVLRWDFDAPIGWVGYFEIYWDVTKPFVMDRQLKPSHIDSGSRALVIANGGRETLIQTFGCDRIIRFVITAHAWDGNNGGFETNDFFYHNLPQCQIWATVTFDTLELPWTGDGADSGPCDGLEVYYTLMVNEQKKNFWGGCSFNVGCFLKDLQCGTYSFKDLASPTVHPYPDLENTFSVPIYTENINLKILTLFYDYDRESGDDLFAPYIEYHSWSTRAQAEAELGCNGKSFSTDLYVNDTADSILHYTIRLIPNPCGANYTP
jgi:LysM repeat protein